MIHGALLFLKDQGDDILVSAGVAELRYVTAGLVCIVQNYRRCSFSRYSCS